MKKNAIESIENLKTQEGNCRPQLKQKNSSKLREIFLEWSKRSSVDCYGKIFEYETHSVRVVWLFIFVASVSFTAFIVNNTIMEYFDHEVVSQIRVVYEKPVEFPAVTICNNNPFTTKEAREIFLQNYYVPMYKDIISWPHALKLFKMLASETESLSDETRKSFGLNMDNIQKCTYGGVECKNDLHWYWSFEFGNCFQFNVGLNLTNNEINRKYSRLEGMNDGLKFEIFPFTIDNEWSKFQYDFGFVVFVHNSSFRPTMSDAVMVRPGEATHISIARTFISNTPFPYSSCKELTAYNSHFYTFILNSPQFMAYRQRDCFNLCMQVNILKTCGCFFTGFDMPLAKNITRPCLNLTDYTCYTKVISEFDPIACETESCPLQCEYVEYNKVVSGHLAPHHSYYSNPLNAEEWPPFNFTTPIIYQEWVTLFCTIYVYYDTLSYTQISELPKISLVDLITNIGGSMTLIVSLSIFSLIELVELFCLILNAFLF